MKKIILPIYLFVIRLYRNLKWVLCINGERKKNKIHREIRGIPSGKKIILIPHADDEWIGCSGIVGSTDDEVILCNMDMSGDDSESLHAIRYKELESIALKYNRKLLTIGKNKVDDLKMIIVNEKPEYIALPFFVDWHEEHIRVMDMLEEVLLMLGEKVFSRIIMYQVSVPIPEKYTTNFIKFSKWDLKKKWSVFKKVYKSQRIGIPIVRFMSNERINGARVDAYACEAFSELDARTWIRLREKMDLSVKEKRKIARNLQDIASVRRIVDNLLK